MNLNAYDDIIEKVDKTKTWVDIKNKTILSREIKYRPYVSLLKRYNIKSKCYEYYIALLLNRPLNKTSFRTLKDNYGRVKIRVGQIWAETSLNKLNKDNNIDIKFIEQQEDGEIYRLYV